MFKKKQNSEIKTENVVEEIQVTENEVEKIQDTFNDDETISENAENVAEVEKNEIKNKNTL